MYSLFIKEVESTSLFVFPVKEKAFEERRNNIISLTLLGYATEVNKQKTEVQTRLTYLRDRIKNNSYVSQTRKLYFSDALEIIAGSVFETNSDLTGIKRALVLLEDQDGAITKEVESVRKESLMGELQLYKVSCQELLSYFLEKNSEANVKIASACISSAEALMSSNYAGNGADYLETLSRERVFTSMQKALQAKQQLIQNEQYALLLKQKEEERLTVVPPSPRQEGKIVVVNIGLQRLYAYENGVSLFPNAITITTGKQGFETVTGEFAIYLKELRHKMVSPFPGIYYDDVVDYWMPFYLGYGLHDAPWRAIYGTQDYPIVGSHGCVNIPLNATSILYNWAEVGTRVIVL